MNCKQTYPLLPANTRVHTFWFTPWFSWVVSQCAFCHRPNSQFLGEAYEQTLEALTEADIEFYIHDFAEDTLIGEYHDVYGGEVMAEHELTKRMEGELQGLHEVLENIPDDLLWAELTSPAPPHELPEMWT